ncbi:putative membrane protein [Bradyrhizobium elkanii]|nr:putative membrane protein [Bradyrhizobium elkanii]MCS3970501.1 putative membrane protein [Bradyrhizobium japonicum]
MSVAPLLEAAPAIPLHAFAAMAAFVLGLVQFAAPKGTLPHRTIGWIWVGLWRSLRHRRSGSTRSVWSGRSARFISYRSSRW